MYLKRYTAAAFILMALIGSYFYISFPNEKLALTIVGINLPSLSIAILIVLAMFVLYISSVGHMLYYSIVASFKMRKFRKDSEIFVESITDALLGRIERNHVYKTDRYSIFGRILDVSRLDVLEDIAETGDEKLDQTIELLKKIKNGEPVDLKKYRLSHNNPLVIKNDLNAYHAGDISEEQILNSADRYSEELVSLAFMNYAKTAPLQQIEKYKAFLTKPVLFNIVARVNADENILDISTDHLISLFSELEITEEGYINLSATLSNNMLPDERIKLFKQLSDENEIAIPAYLYTLFDLEMIAPAEEILENSQADEYTYFKAYKALKDCHQNFAIELFIPHKIYS
ncbi:MAG: hypothetical protein PF439_03740 [Helicobacteraceae bacterium]|jgi:hypothetical protein|nr:hypothetical protein [Helicobacteraceae bacterium]